jgi:hypothetical protein
MIKTKLILSVPVVIRKGQFYFIIYSRVLK